MKEAKKTGFGMNWIEWIIYDVVLESQNEDENINLNFILFYYN